MSAHPSRAQALHLAHALNLRASDIPEASIARREQRRSTAGELREYKACEPKINHAHMLATAGSPRLKRGSELETEEFASLVAVVSDQRRIPAEFSVLKKPTVLRCLARAFTRNFSEKRIRRASWGRFTVSKLALRLPGAAANVGIRVTAPLNLAVSEVSVPVYVDLLDFSSGPLEVQVIAGSATQPVPSTTEQELLTLLLARARTQPH